MAEDTSSFQCDELMGVLNSIHYSVHTYRDAHIILAQHLDEQNSDEEMRKIYHLVESHCPQFRARACSLFEKAKLNTSFSTFPINAEHVSIECFTKLNVQKGIDDILMKVELMPKEWTLVQLTSMHCKWDRQPDSELQISVFECGQNKRRPFTIRVPGIYNSSGAPESITKTLQEFIAENNEGYVNLRNRLQNQLKETYTEFKYRINNTLKRLLQHAQDRWLGAWRMLLAGRFVSADVEAHIEKGVRELAKRYEDGLTERHIQILRYLLRAQGCLDLKESMKVLHYCFPHVKTPDLVALVKEVKAYAVPTSEERHPIILIADETVDCVPWEMMDVMANQPVSRMQSFHFTYGLFDAHESQINAGYVVMHEENMKGGALLNPNLDLECMGNRLTTFHNYWTPTWERMCDKRPTQEEFLNFITNFDLFMYSGHGDGMQFINPKSLLKLRINAVVVLFGCSSVAFKAPTHSIEAWGSNQYYIMCCCPCIVGNLYHITDIDCDLMSTTFLSNILSPPAGKVHWLDLDLEQWRRGSKVEDATKFSSTTSIKRSRNPNVLSVINQIKKPSAVSYVTRAACVARGLPVKLL